MKKRIINIGILSLIFVMVAISPSITSNLSSERQADIIFAQSQDVFKYIPASTRLEPILDTYLTPSVSGEEPNVVVEYDTRTGVEREYAVNYDEIVSDITRLEPNKGEYLNFLQEQSVQVESIADGLHSSSDLGVDELIQINDTDVYPYSAVVKIIGKLNETHVAWGSGAMIDSNHVITAGHVIYDFDGGWRQDVRVIPGMNGPGETLTARPFGVAYATVMRSTTGWTEDHSQEHDWAVITLDRDIGDETGWLGVLGLPESHANYTEMVHTAGYPAEVKDGYYMWTTSGAGGSADALTHQYTFYGEGGQSGSGVWTHQNSSPYVISIYAYGPGGGGIGSGTRITEEKFDILTQWLEQDASSEAQADLSVSGSNNLFADLDFSKNVLRLITGIPITTSVQNYGNIAVNKVTLGFYLSVDEEITTDDYQISTKIIRNLGALELKIVDHTARVPVSVPPGRYEIGWIIDPDNEIDEYFEDNNSFLNGLNIQVYSTFLDTLLTDPLWLSIWITGVVLIIAVPTIIAIVRRKKRMK